MRHFYFNERSSLENLQWKESGDFSIPGPPGWKNEEGNNGDLDWKEPDVTGADLFPEKAIPALRVAHSGRLLVDQTGKLHFCRQSCKAVPGIVVLTQAHSRCIQLNCLYESFRPLLNAPDKSFNYQLWPFEKASVTAIKKTAYSGFFSLPEPGEKLCIQAKWQSGHYPLSDVSKMKFFVMGVSSPWMTIPLNSWRRIAEVQVNERRQIFVNYIRGWIRGNVND